MLPSLMMPKSNSTGGCRKSETTNEVESFNTTHASGFTLVCPFPRRRHSMRAKQSKPGIVFAQGLWADGSCFGKVIPTLQAEGHEVIASQHGLDSLKGDVAAVKRAIGRVNGPVIL